MKIIKWMEIPMISYYVLPGKTVPRFNIASLKFIQDIFY